MARSISILLAARISSFLSVNSSANWQIISPLWKCSQNEQVTQLSTRGQCCTDSGWTTVLAELITWPGCKDARVRPQLRATSVCCSTVGPVWVTTQILMRTQVTQVTFQMYSPAGLISVKKVPTFLPSTMSVMTWPVTLGWVPFAMTTEVPLCKAQTAAFTYNRTSLLEEKHYFIYITLQMRKIRVWLRDFSKNRYQMAWTLHSAWLIHLFYQTTYTTVATAL